MADYARAERLLGIWHFEGGGFVRIEMSGDATTEEALDMVETLIRIKREELQRRAALDGR